MGVSCVTRESGLSRTKCKNSISGRAVADPKFEGICKSSSRRRVEQQGAKMVATKGGVRRIELDSPFGRAVLCPSCEGSSRRGFQQQVAEMMAAQGGASPKELDSPLGCAGVGPSCEGSSRWLSQQQVGEIKAVKGGASHMELDSPCGRAGVWPRFEGSSRRRFEQQAAKMAAAKGRASPMELGSPFGRAVGCRRVEQPLMQKCVSLGKDSFRRQRVKTAGPGRAPRKGIDICARSHMEIRRARARCARTGTAMSCGRWPRGRDTICEGPCAATSRGQRRAGAPFLPAFREVNKQRFEQRLAKRTATKGGANPMELGSQRRAGGPLLPAFREVNEQRFEQRLAKRTTTKGGANPMELGSRWRWSWRPSYGEVRSRRTSGVVGNLAGGTKRRRGRLQQSCRETRLRPRFGGVGGQTGGDRRTSSQQHGVRREEARPAASSGAIGAQAGDVRRRRCQRQGARRGSSLRRPWGSGRPSVGLGVREGQLRPMCGSLGHIRWGRVGARPGWRPVGGRLRQLVKRSALRVICAMLAASRGGAESVPSIVCSRHRCGTPLRRSCRLLGPFGRSSGGKRRRCVQPLGTRG